MSFIIPLPSIIKESTTLVLLPQLSLLERLKKEKKNYFSSGPKLFDCFIPLIGKNGEIVISPFLGNVGICTLVQQIFTQTQKPLKVYFYGTCGAIDSNNLKLGDLVNPSNFIIEEKPNEFESIIENQIGFTLISTSFIFEESFDKLYSLYLSRNISLIDMELGFLWRLALKYNQKIISSLLITDVWSESSTSPQPKNPSSLKSYPLYLENLLNLFP